MVTAVMYVASKRFDSGVSLDVGNPFSKGSGWGGSN